MDFLGNKIRTLRIDKGLGQIDMKQEFNVGINTWSQYENNKRVPDIETLKKIGKFFNVSMDYLLGITKEKYDPKDSSLIELIKIFCLLPEGGKKELVVLAENFIEAKSREE